MVPLTPRLLGALLLLLWFMVYIMELEKKSLKQLRYGYWGGANVSFEELFFKFENTVAHSLPQVRHVDYSRETDAPLLPEISPSNAPQPFIPLLAPAPLAPFFNNSTPKLSGQCSLNFTAVDSLMSTTAVDCFASFAPFLANVICCPQLQAMITILIGQSSKSTGLLALDSTHANFCLSDIQQLLASQGGSSDLQSVCSINFSNLTRDGCRAGSVLSSAKQVLRQISNCNVNGACPLDFPDTTKVAKACGESPTNHSSCCNAMNNYVSHLQKQSFITNLQALDCASSLGQKLQDMNVSTNIYSLCQITLKDFSLQESGCLLPSLPSDATFDRSSGISFTCDLNDNIAAPWPSSSQASASSCNKSTNFPALPAATSAQHGVYVMDMKSPVLMSLFLSLLILIQR
uniref:Uncharacterized protein n=1 Tax=Ananas comosus var. bracteatus TaxID=296719 RepID=A0A6V7QCZ5_ANACO|nr:unnamed protein product [Ananas comosus var. bracteatus]